MAPMLFKEMKGGVNKFSCASPATTAVCTSIDRRSIVQPRALDGSAAAGAHRHAPSRASSASSRTLGAHQDATTTGQNNHKNKNSRRTSAVTITDLIVSPPGSSRYLLNTDHDIFPVSEAAPAPASSKASSTEMVAVSSAASPSAAAAQQPQNQVVVLRVSLHCKGCAGKVKKHLSKMEGVTSFDIDLATKKVTVVGDVTPLGVLNSISKVKNAQFWPPSPPPPPPRCSSTEAI